MRGRTRYQAPSVKYPVKRSGIFLMAAVFFAVFTLPIWNAWWWSNGMYQSWFDQVLGLTLVVIAMGIFGVLLIHWHRGLEGMLVWVNSSWCLKRAEADTQVHVSVVLDWQFVLLLQVTACDNKHYWIWLERRWAPLDWNSLRRAVYSG